MQYFNNASFDAVQNTELEFTLTLQAGREAIPANSKGVVMTLIDSAGNAARVLMDAVGSTYTIVRIFSTTEPDNTVPTFGIGLSALSSDVAEAISISTTNAGVLILGQSNALGKNTKKANVEPIYFNEFDHRVKQTTYFQSPRSDENYVYAVEPLLFPFLQTTGADNLGPGIPFAHKLLTEGYSGVTLLPHAVNSTQLDIFSKASNFRYNFIVENITEFLNDSPNNRFAAWLHLQGESDVLGVTTVQEYLDEFALLVSDVRADVFANTGIDISRVPVLAVGMNEDWRVSGGYDPTEDIELAIAAIPTVVPYSAYIELGLGLSVTSDPNEATTDDIHLSAPGCIEAARLAFNALSTARMNYNPTGALSVSVGTATETDTANPVVPQVVGGDISVAVGTALETTTANSVTAQVSGPISVAVGTATETDTANGVDPSAVSTTAPAPVYNLQRGVNQTLYGAAGSAIQNWNSTVGGYTTTSNFQAFGPIDLSGAADFQGIHVLNLTSAGTVFSNANGGTVIFDIDPDATASLVTNPLLKGGNLRFDVGGEAIFQGTTLTFPAIAEGVRTWAAMTIDQNAGTMSVVVGGTTVASTSSLSAFASTTGTPALGSGTSAAYDGRLFNMYISDEPMTSAQMQDAADTYFVT